MGNKSSVNIVLVEDSKALEEVVVVGYGTQKKVNLTGAVETVKSDRLANKPVTSIAFESSTKTIFTDDLFPTLITCVL